MKTREKVLEEIIENSFNIYINLNDVFHYACSDAEGIDSEDYLELIPLIQKYGSAAEFAYCAIKRGYDPQVTQRLTPEYHQAKAEILQMIYEGDKYSPFYGIMENLNYPKEDLNWKEKFNETFGVKEKIPYLNIVDAFSQLNIKVGDIIGCERTGYKVRVTAIGKNNALVETVEIKGQKISGWGDQVLELYSFLKWLK